MEGEALQEKIRTMNQNRHPRTVSELLAFVQSENSQLSEIDILTEIRHMSQKGDLILAPRTFGSFPQFWVDFRWNVDFWLIVLIGIFGLLSVFATLVFPISLLRLLFAIPLFFYFPGHNLLRIFATSAILTNLERVLLDFATSLVIVLFLGLALNFSSLGFHAVSSFGIVILFDLISGFLASYESYNIARSRG